MPTTIAGVVLTKNEEDTVGRSLDSLGFCDEVVVVDSGSSDDTTTRAAERGARVLVNKPSGPFLIADQRNWALSHPEIRSTWVLFLDADEVIPGALSDIILAAVRGARKEVAGFELAPKVMFWGKWIKHSSGFPNWHPRLVRRSSARLAGGVWERFDTSGRIERISTPYDHFANHAGFDSWLDRHVRYARFEASQICGGVNVESSALRRDRIRRLSYRFWIARPLVRFVLTYFLRLGFLDGLAGLAYASSLVFYEFMVIMFVIERRRTQCGLPL